MTVRIIFGRINRCVIVYYIMTDTHTDHDRPVDRDFEITNVEEAVDTVEGP